MKETYHQSILVCCLALGAILIPTASAAEGIYEDFTYVDFFFHRKHV